PPRLRARTAGTGGRPAWLVRPRPVLAGAGAGITAGLLTGWPVAGLWTALAVLALPGLVAVDRTGPAMIARVEAVAGWTEQLRDILSAAAGLEQAITATAPIAPEPIRADIATLAAALARGERLAPALRATADRLADPTADLVIAALISAAERHARDLTGLLGSLAAAAREQAAMRLRVAAGRARTRTSTRVIVAVTALMATGLILLDGSYLDPYDSPGGQLVLLTVGGLFAGAYAWMGRITRIRPATRILTRTTATFRQTSR
ncbi:type II secretion system F family protein, partial [Frankia sp. Cj3]|uniref:type II secretion system F family protein n=1 Tax=Frankia sp. Cj3 TaxID=2880976 RepID=UPI001EF5463E